MAKKRVRASSTKRAKTSKKKAARKPASVKGTRKAVKKKAVRKAAAKAPKRTAKATKKKTTRKVAKRPKVKRAAKTLKKKVARKTVKKAIKKKATRKAAKKTVRKAAAKKTTKKRTTRKKVTRRPVTKKRTAAKPRATKPVKPAAKPKRPRRTKQAMPPDLRVVPAPVVDVEPLTPPPPPPPIEAEWVAAPPGVAVGPPAQASDPAPDFDLCDETGQQHALAQYRGQNVVLYFYPKDDTPGCTAEACGFRDTLGDFERHNAVVLGVSPDPVDSHWRFSQRYGLTFPLLADEDHAVAEKYGVWVEKKDGYGNTYMGIARTTFLIDPAGRIAHIFHDVQPHGHEREILEHLRR